MRCVCAPSSVQHLPHPGQKIKNERSLTHWRWQSVRMACRRTTEMRAVLEMAANELNLAMHYARCVPQRASATSVRLCRCGTMRKTVVRAIPSSTDANLTATVALSPRNDLTDGMVRPPMSCSAVTSCRGLNVAQTDSSMSIITVQDLRARVRA